MNSPLTSSAHIWADLQTRRRARLQGLRQSLDERMSELGIAPDHEIFGGMRFPNFPAQAIYQADVLEAVKIYGYLNVRMSEYEEANR